MLVLKQRFKLDVPKKRQKSRDVAPEIWTISAVANKIMRVKKCIVDETADVEQPITNSYIRISCCEYHARNRCRHFKLIPINTTARVYMALFIHHSPFIWDFVIVVRKPRT